MYDSEGELIDDPAEVDWQVPTSELEVQDMMNQLAQLETHA